MVATARVVDATAAVVVAAVVGAALIDRVSLRSAEECVRLAKEERLLIPVVALTPQSPQLALLTTRLLWISPEPPHSRQSPRTHRAKARRYGVRGNLNG